MSFKKRVIDSAKKAILGEGLVMPERIMVYERKKLGPEDDGLYGQADVRQRKGGKVTSAKEVFVRRNPGKGFNRLSDDNVRQAMSHELSHLRYATHSKPMGVFAKKIYKKYMEDKSKKVHDTPWSGYKKRK